MANEFVFSKQSLSLWFTWGARPILTFGVMQCVCVCGLQVWAMFLHLGSRNLVTFWWRYRSILSTKSGIRHSLHISTRNPTTHILPVTLDVSPVLCILLQYLYFFSFAATDSVSEWPSWVNLSNSGDRGTPWRQTTYFSAAKKADKSPFNPLVTGARNGQKIDFLLGNHG